MPHKNKGLRQTFILVPLCMIRSAQTESLPLKPSRWIQVPLVVVVNRGEMLDHLGWDEMGANYRLEPEPKVDFNGRSA